MPLYLNEHQYVLFLHIPKTAGTTIESWLCNSGKYEQILFSQQRPDDLMVTPQHMGYDTLSKLTYAIRRPIEYKFAIVRNPFDRLISEFFYRTKLNNINLGENSGELFSCWVTRNLKKYKKNNTFLDNHLRPQSYYIGNDVEVFKFEDGIHNAINTIGEKLGIEVDQEIEAKKVSERKEVFWDKASVALVLDVYAEDFKNFEYSTKTTTLKMSTSHIKKVRNNAKFIYYTVQRKCSNLKLAK